MPHIAKLFSIFMKNTDFFVVGRTAIHWILHWAGCIWSIYSCFFLKMTDIIIRPSTSRSTSWYWKCLCNSCPHDACPSDQSWHCLVTTGACKYAIPRDVHWFILSLLHARSPTENSISTSRSIGHFCAHVLPAELLRPSWASLLGLLDQETRNCVRLPRRADVQLQCRCSAGFWIYISSTDIPVCKHRISSLYWVLNRIWLSLQISVDNEEYFANGWRKQMCCNYARFSLRRLWRVATITWDCSIPWAYSSLRINILFPSSVWNGGKFDVLVSLQGMMFACKVGSSPFIQNVCRLIAEYWATCHQQEMT
jgi:hypothetical protein